MYESSRNLHFPSNEPTLQPWDGLSHLNEATESSFRMYLCSHVNPQCHIIWILYTKLLFTAALDELKTKATSIKQAINRSKDDGHEPQSTHIEMKLRNANSLCLLLLPQWRLFIFISFYSVLVVNYHSLNKNWNYYLQCILWLFIKKTVHL